MILEYKLFSLIPLIILVVACSDEQTPEVAAPLSQPSTTNSSSLDIRETANNPTVLPETTAFPPTPKQEFTAIHSPNADELIELAMSAMEDVTSYKVAHEYFLDSDLVTEQSNDGDSLTISDCNIAFQEGNTQCTIETTIGIEGDLQSVESEIIIVGEQAWYQQIGHDWILISSEEVRMPGLVDGMIQPTQFLVFAQDPSITGEFTTPDRVFYEISFMLDVEPFIEMLLGEDKSSQLFNMGTDFISSGTVWIDKEDNLIHEFSAIVNFSVDEVPASIQLTQSLSSHNKPVGIKIPES